MKFLQKHKELIVFGVITFVVVILAIKANEAWGHKLGDWSSGKDKIAA